MLPSVVPVIHDFAASDVYKRTRRAYDVLTATGLLVDREGRFLLQHRDDKPGIDNPGRWGSFGGMIEPYETPEEGFLRELEEELSWRPATFGLVSAVSYKPDDRWQLIYVYDAARRRAARPARVGRRPGHGVLRAGRAAGGHRPRAAYAHRRVRRRRALPRAGLTPGPLSDFAERGS